MGGRCASVFSACFGLLALAAALWPASANAGAWIAPVGGQEIWTHTAGQDEYGFVFYETSAFWELPVGESPISFVATPWLSETPANPEGFRAEATIAAKTALFRSDRGAMALQGGVLWVSDPQFGCSEAGVEARWLGGLSLGDEGRGFVNLEVAARALEGGCTAQKLDLTAGYRPNDRWMGLAQLFVDIREPDADPVLKAQLTLVRFGGEARGIQFGVRSRLDGGASEHALVLGFWGRPGQ